MIHPRRTPVPLSADSARGAAPFTPDTESVIQPGPFWAKLTGQAAGTNRYAWTQVDEGDDPTFDAVLSEAFAATGTSAVDGSPAYEINGRRDVPVGRRVKLWPAADLSYYLFDSVEDLTGFVTGTGTDNRVALWNGTGVPVIKDSPITVNPSTGQLYGFELGFYTSGPVGALADTTLGLWTPLVHGEQSIGALWPAFADSLQPGGNFAARKIVGQDFYSTATGISGEQGLTVTTGAGLRFSSGLYVGGSFTGATLGANSFTAGQSIAASGAANTPLSIALAAAQTAPAILVEASGGADLFTVDAAGAVTGASFSGSGSGLTSIPAAELTGTVDGGTF